MQIYDRKFLYGVFIVLFAISEVCIRCRNSPSDKLRMWLFDYEQVAIVDCEYPVDIDIVIMRQKI